MIRASDTSHRVPSEAGEGRQADLSSSAQAGADPTSLLYLALLLLGGGVPRRI